MPILVEAAPAFDWLNALTGLAGVLLGGLITYFVTYQFEKRRTNDERLGRSYSVMFAVLQIADDLTKMEQDITAGLAKAAATDPPAEFWTKMPTSVGFSDPIVIPSADLTVVALSRDQGLTKEVGEVEAAHRIYVQSMLRLEQLREQFQSFGLGTDVQGNTVGFEANEAQLVQIAPTLIQLRTLGDAIAEGVPPAAKQARSVAERLGPHLKSHYRFKHFISLSFPQAGGQTTEEAGSPAEAEATAPTMAAIQG